MAKKTSKKKIREDWQLLDGTKHLGHPHFIRADEPISLKDDTQAIFDGLKNFPDQNILVIFSNNGLTNYRFGIFPNADQAYGLVRKMINIASVPDTAIETELSQKIDAECAIPSLLAILDLKQDLSEQLNNKTLERILPLTITPIINGHDIKIYQCNQSEEALNMHHG